MRWKVLCSTGFLCLLYVPMVYAASVTLAWDYDPADAATITGFSIERCQNAGCTVFGVLTPTALLPTVRSYTDTFSLQPGSVYRYKARALAAGGVVSEYTPIVDVSIPATAPIPPEKPANFRATVLP